mmetsp:Transcript_13777/g.32415  ORF Transcript_13777/g.32415 Transcript_13777/m.32415 type:complete len:249 (-) Transcript_13777:66-812(-)
MSLRCMSSQSPSSHSTTTTSPPGMMVAMEPSIPSNSRTTCIPTTSIWHLACSCTTSSTSISSNPTCVVVLSAAFTAAAAAAAGRFAAPSFPFFAATPSLPFLPSALAVGARTFSTSHSASNFQPGSATTETSGLGIGVQIPPSDHAPPSSGLSHSESSFTRYSPRPAWKLQIKPKCLDPTQSTTTVAPSSLGSAPARTATCPNVSPDRRRLRIDTTPPRSASSAHGVREISPTPSSAYHHAPGPSSPP